MRHWVLVGLVVTSFLRSPAAANDWVGGGGDNLWNNPNNWLQKTTVWVDGEQMPGLDVFIVPPDATTHPNFGWDDPGGLFYPLTPDLGDDFPRWVNDAKFPHEGTTTLIDSTVTDATAYGVRIGLDGASNTLEVTGGSLQIGGIPPGETDRVGWHLDVGRGFNRSANPTPIARMVMTGGIVDTNLIKVPEGFVDGSLADPYDTPGINGELIMSGGTITGRKLNIGQFTGNGYAELSGDAVINLWPSVASNPNNAGHFEMKQDWFIDGQPVATVADAHLDIRDNAVMNIFGNMSELSMTPDQTEVARYQQYVDDGWLTANNGTAEPLITLQNCPDDGTLDDICLSGMMITITAPESVLPGDFDDNGAYECADVDALVTEIVAGTNTASFDLTDDGLVDNNDLTAWLGFAGPALGFPGPILPGDSNLDGSVDVSDFNVWNTNKFTTGAWCAGDFTADGSVDVSDFNVWNTNKFMSSDTHAVPEPAGWLLVVFGLACWKRRG